MQALSELYNRPIEVYQMSIGKFCVVLKLDAGFSSLSVVSSACQEDCTKVVKGNVTK